MRFNREISWNIRAPASCCRKRLGEWASLHAFTREYSGYSSARTGFPGGNLAGNTKETAVFPFPKGRGKGIIYKIKGAGRTIVYSMINKNRRGIP